ncbi:TIGR00282 family metallophosphoesterase [Temperatibacter marinus]|uniref:TIGR00282 family metallophosphoesterase n=1 Tax=Temperatibacter marinus TaxID=1456591 RepID=A0AA52EI17_9PROT|nr:TIGR00282 family metallophosphoesterase [Temperatibacter marinus]WND04018.1 TIGR00282 family metallophosphoesterase [Temperatibacter marinus]
MRILFLGDLMGRSGRDAAIAKLPDLKRQLKLDFIIVNAENAASGFGMTSKICNQVFDTGAHVITGGNHSFDQKEVLSILDSDKRILRPANYPQQTPGRGYHVYEVAMRKILVINLMGRVFMHPVLDCPFETVDTILSKYRLGKTVDAIVVDFHGEATSEKMAMGHYLDGRVSMVVGTHSHVPTADTMILNKGTAYQTDAGMCGDYDSVIGMTKEEPVSRFVTKMNRERFSPAQGEATLCGTYVELDRKGIAHRIEPVRIGPRLLPHIPKV